MRIPLSDAISCLTRRRCRLRLRLHRRVISSIMIINMLIADFTRTFESIYDEADQWWRMEYYKL